MHELGGIDILVSNAGYQNRKSLADLTPEEFDKTFKTNVHAYYHLVHHAVPKMKRGSVIIATSSATSFEGSELLPDYSATKGAINQFALAAHVEALGAPDVLCLQEVRLRPRHTTAIATARTLLPGYRCALALCDDPRNVTFRGGRAYGVATYVHARCGELVTASPAWDREGRVLVTALPDRQLAIVNLYAVNGTAKPYVAPATGAPLGDRHAHKRRFQDAVFALAADLRADAQVVLIGDWNVSRAAIDVTPRLSTEEPHATARAQLNGHLARGGWRDVFRDQHPATRAYTWFGKTRCGRLDAARVDYALVGDELAPHVTSAAILDEPRLRPHSDHAPIVLELAR